MDLSQSARVVRDGEFITGNTSVSDGRTTIRDFLQTSKMNSLRVIIGSYFNYIIRPWLRNRYVYGNY